MFKRFLFVCAATALLAACAAPPGGGAAPASSSGTIVMEEFRVTSEPGIQVYVRNKRPKGMTQFSADKTVIYVHGATSPSETAFDLPLDGMSWMDYIARQGCDVYLLDVRGYGGSTRPAQMERHAAENAPFAGTVEAMRDVDAVVEFVKKRRGIEKVNLLAWS